MAEICSENEAHCPWTQFTAGERGGHWRGDLGGQLKRLANGLVGRPLGDVSGMWGGGAEEMFLKESILLSLLKMACHQLV